MKKFLYICAYKIFYNMTNVDCLKVLKLIQENSEVDKVEDIKPTDSFRSDLGMDSLDVMSVLNEVETSYNVTIPIDDVYDLKTVQELIDYLKTKL